VISFVWGSVGSSKELEWGLEWEALPRTFLAENVQKQEKGSAYRTTYRSDYLSDRERSRSDCLKVVSRKELKK